MNEATFVEFMKRLGGAPDQMKKMERLVQLSGKAMTLMKKINATPPEERVKYRDELAAVHDELSEEYKTILGDMGMTHESLQAYVENPKNFSPEGWALAQSVKEQFKEELNTPPTKERKRGSKQRKAWLSA